MSGSGSSSSITARFVVTTVIFLPCRWRAICSVEVPMSIITVWPSSTSDAAAAPRRSLTSKRSTSICEKPGSWPECIGAAVDALELAVARQRVQIAAHGHLRHAEALGQVGHVRGAAAHGAQDLLTALCGQERHR